MYPSEETTRRNRWQDEFDAQTREHRWASMSEYNEAYQNFLDDDRDARWYDMSTVAERDRDDDTDIPADVRAQFESE